jgi:hypothetical protein
VDTDILCFEQLQIGSTRVTEGCYSNIHLSGSYFAFDKLRQPLPELVEGN